MRIFVDTSDKRNQVVLKLLQEAGKDASVYLENINRIQKGDIIVFSPAKKFLYEEVVSFCPHTVIYCGNLPEEILKLFADRMVKVNNLLDDEFFAIQNARLTAEGVLSLIIEKTEKSIEDVNVLFLGGGRISKASAILLKKLGVFVGIASYNKADYNMAHYYSDRAYYKEEYVSALKDFDVIVNTRPFCYIDVKILKNLKRDALFLETASVKCISEENSEGVNYILAPALPQRFACYSAGKIIADKILGELND